MKQVAYDAGKQAREKVAGKKAREKVYRNVTVNLLSPGDPSFSITGDLTEANFRELLDKEKVKAVGIGGRKTFASSL